MTTKISDPQALKLLDELEILYNCPHRWDADTARLLFNPTLYMSFFYNHPTHIRRPSHEKLRVVVAKFRLLGITVKDWEDEDGNNNH